MYKQITIILLVIATALYFFLNYTEPPTAKPINITWFFETKEGYKVTSTQTKVTLEIDKKVYDTGTHEGSCEVVEKSELLPDELSGVLCLWKGSSVEIGVFKEQEKLYLKKRTAKESSEKESNSIGNFETLSEI